MRVQQILKGKSGAGVTTVRPGTSIEEAVRVLSEQRIGALVISPDGKKVDGILSERDIVRELGRRGVACMSDTVEAFMTRDPITVTLDEESDDVFRKMTEGRFRHMPVTQEGALVGIVTLGDVVKAQLSELKMEKDALEGMIMGY